MLRKHSPKRKIHVSKQVDHNSNVNMTMLD